MLIASTDCNLLFPCFYHFIYFSTLEWFRLRREGNMCWIVCLLGLVLLFAPFLFGFTGSEVAFWTCFALGLMLALAGGIKGVLK